MTRRNIAAKRVLLTGASSGIGHELALQLSALGARLIVTARREEKLRELVATCQSQHRTVPQDANCPDAALDIRYIAGDISCDSTRRQLIQEIETHWGALDVLINNAGVGAVGLFHEAAADRLQRIMDVNFLAPAELIRASLPLLRQGAEPIIVNVGSVLGHVGVPKKSEYCASKFALRGFSDALRIELAADAIDVLWVAPNTTSSEFFDQMIERKGNVAENPLSMTPAAVAKKIVSAIRSGHPQRILTLSGRLLILIRRWFPRTLTRILKMSG